MSAMRILTVLLVGALTMTWAGAAKAVPDAVPYIGYLTDDQGPYDSSGTPLEISVTVYDQEAGGQLVWGPCNFSQPVENGVFVVVLDAIACPGMNDTPLPTTGAWLEFTVATTPLQGRQELLSVPYALWADSTQTCEEASSLTQEGDGSVTAADLAAKDHNHDALYVNEGQAGSVTAGMLGPDAVTGPAIASGSIALADLGDWGCQDGQVVKWVDGSSLWACANDL
ncbi:MAG: hypothetical protein FJ098_14635, partial [Deltaproteobacteria bacterium]|nr:hypothetical protein [Deltaproteobacteria bacterium]